MSDLIERSELIKKLNIIENVTQKDKPKFIWQSVFRQINEMETIDENDCRECLMSLPKRKWHKVADKLPDIRKKVLVETVKGNYYIAYYCSKNWWYEDRELGDISYYFNEEEIVRWKEIE